VIFAGTTFARQRISSAIQLPIPEKPDCISTTALIGAFEWRFRKSSKNARWKLAEAISGIALFHQTGSSLPW